MEKMQNKNLSKAGMLWYISTSIALLSGGVSQSGVLPQGAASPRKPRDVEHLTYVKVKQAKVFIQINLHLSKSAAALLC